MSTALEMRISALLTGLASCLCAELTVAEEESGITKPCLCTVLPGAQVAFDYCADGGMAWSRLVSIDPIATTPGKCAVEYVATVELGILRCAPTLGEGGELPSEAEQLAASMQQFFDMGVLHKAVTCCVAPSSFAFESVGTFTPVGPDGKCIGGTWTASWRFS